MSSIGTAREPIITLNGLSELFVNIDNSEFIKALT